MSITLRVSDEQVKLIQEVAKFSGLTVSEYIRKTVLEHIEDEYDLRELELAKAEAEASGVAPIPHKELMKKYGL